MAGLLCFMVRGVFAVGPFIDVFRVSAFLRSPQESSLDGTITRSDADEAKASMFVLSANFPLRSALLLRLEFPYATVAVDEGTEDGFGDAALRLNARLWKGSRKSLLLTSSLRMGSGSLSLFPFASGTTDVEAGLAFVDSVGLGEGANTLEPLGSFSYWIMGGGAYPLRVNETLVESHLYDRYAEAGGGVLAALTKRIELEAGGMGLVFPEGAVREIVFSRLSFALSEVARVSFIVQKELGDESDRAADASAGIDLTVNY